MLVLFGEKEAAKFSPMPIVTDIFLLFIHTLIFDICARHSIIIIIIILSLLIFFTFYQDVHNYINLNKHEI